MANDRLFLTCSGCGAGFMLAKHFGDAWSTRNPSKGPSLEERLDIFFDEHWRCMAGEVADPHKFYLLNELEQQEFKETSKVGVKD